MLISGLIKGKSGGVRLKVSIADRQPGRPG
jgi:hypothetical protein